MHPHSARILPHESYRKAQLRKAYLIQEALMAEICIGSPKPDAA
jgi:hypothetical protein